jgi:hypothetical protein
LQTCAIPREAPPVAGGEGTRVVAHPDLRVEPAAVAVVGRRVEIRAAGDIRLRGHDPEIGVLRHSDDIGHHDPVVAVDERAVIPVGQLLREPTSLRRKVAHDHQPWNVVDAVGLSAGGEGAVGSLAG